MACPQSGSNTLISLSALVLQKHDTKGEELQQPHLDLGKEMSEAAFWVDLKCRSQVQYELHDDGLVGHLLHQGVFLEVNKRELLPNVVLIVFHKVSLWNISLNRPPIKNNDCITQRFTPQVLVMFVMFASERRTIDVQGASD